LSADLVRHLRRLPAVDRDTLLIVVWGELSYEEAARALEVPVGTVRSRIARAGNGSAWRSVAEMP
jgi:DNA-directed RNA polymerase specialized sigma24 family protein